MSENILSGRFITGFLLVSCLFTALSMLSGCTAESSAEEDYQEGVTEFTGGKIKTAVVWWKNALSKQPQYPQARIALGEAYLLAGESKAAIKEFTRALDLDSTLARAKYGLARALIGSKEYGKAMELVLKDNSPSGQLLKGDIETASRHFDIAKNFYTELLATEPNFPGAYKGLAKVFWGLGELESVRKYIDQSLAASPDDVEAWVMKGRLAYIEQDYDAALQAMSTALEKNIYDVSKFALEAHSATAMNWLAKQNPANARPHIQELAKASNQSLLHNFLSALAHYQEGKKSEAVALLRGVLSKAPNHVRTLILLGGIEREQGNLSQSLEYLKRVVSLSPGNVFTRKLLGRIYLQTQAPGNAVNVLKPLVTIVPNDAISWGLLGTALLENGQPDEATQAFLKAAALKPGQTEFKQRLAVGYLAKGEGRLAVAQLQSILETEPDNMRSGYLLAVSHYENGDFQSAIKSAQNLLAKQADNAIFENLMGLSYLQLGDREKARAHFMKASELDKSYAIPAVNLASIELSDGNSDSAREILEKILLTNPYHAASLNTLAAMDAAKGDIDRAVDRWRTASEHNADDVDSRLALAGYFRTLGQNENSMRLLEEATIAHPENVRALLLLTRLQLMTGKPNLAKTGADQLMRLAPESPDVLYQAAAVATRLGNVDKARALLTKVLKLDQAYPAAKFALAGLNRQQGIAANNTLSGGGTPESTPRTTQDFILLLQEQISSGAFDKAIATGKKFVEQDPKNINARFLLGSAYRAAGDLKNARRSFLTAVDLKPDSRSARLNLARIEILLGDIKAARRWYLEVLKQKDNDINALLGLADIATQNARLTFLEKAYNADPVRLDAALALADEYIRLNRISDAIPLVDAAVQRSPANRSALYSSARAHLLAGDIAESEKIVQRLIKLYPQWADAHLHSGLVFAARGDFAQSRQSFQKALQLRPGDLRIMQTMASMELDAGQPAKALDRVGELLSKAPKWTAGLMIQGDAYWIQGKRKRALTSYQKAWGQQRSVRLLQKLAKAYWGLGEQKTALELLRENLANDGTSIPVRTTLADMYLGSNNIEQAKTEYEIVIGNSPDNVSVLNKLANIYDMTKDDRALPTARKAYELASEIPEILDTYGWLLIKKGDLQQGLTLLGKAVGLEGKLLNPAEKGTVRFHLAEAYRKSGNNAAARKELETLGSMGIDFPEKALAELTLIRLQ